MSAIVRIETVIWINYSIRNHKIFNDWNSEGQCDFFQCIWMPFQAVDNNLWNCIQYAQLETFWQNARMLVTSDCKMWYFVFVIEASATYIVPLWTCVVRTITYASHTCTSVASWETPMFRLRQFFIVCRLDCSADTAEILHFRNAGFNAAECVVLS